LFNGNHPFKAREDRVETQLAASADVWAGIQLSSIEHLAMRHNNIVDAEARLLLLDEANKQFTFRDNPLKTLDLRYNSRWQAWVFS